MTTVVNLYKTDYDVYIGRAGKGQSGYFGNPHPLGYCSLCKREHDRSDCLSEYEKYFLTRIELDAEFEKKVLDLKGRVLGCFCKPKTCHGDVIAKYLNEHSIQS